MPVVCGNESDSAAPPIRVVRESQDPGGPGFGGGETERAGAVTESSGRRLVDPVAERKRTCQRLGVGLTREQGGVVEVKTEGQGRTGPSDGDFGGCGGHQRGRGFSTRKSYAQRISPDWCCLVSRARGRASGPARRGQGSAATGVRPGRNRSAHNEAAFSGFCRL